MKLIDNMSFKTKCFLGGLTATGLLTPFIFYFSIFGPLSEYSLARNDQAWANFGSFIGGTIGTLFSGLAFIGVLLTYQEMQNQLQAQKEQLEFARSRATIDELQRLLATTVESFEEFLNQPIGIHLENVEFTRKDALEHACALVGNPLPIPDPMFIYLHNEEHNSFMPQHNRYINEIAWCMDEFVKAGGSEKIIEYYRIKLGRPISISRVCGWIHDNALIVKFFPNYD